MSNGQLACGNTNRAIYLWDTDSGQCLKTLRSGRVKALTALPNGLLEVSNLIAAKSFAKALYEQLRIKPPIYFLKDSKAYLL